MNNKISNSKIELSSGIILNDKDSLNQLLYCLKNMINNFSIAKTEASNEFLYANYKEMCEELFILQRSTYELLFINGWFELETASSDKINENLIFFQNQLNDLNQSA